MRPASSASASSADRAGESAGAARRTHAELSSSTCPVIGPRRRRPPAAARSCGARPAGPAHLVGRRGVEREVAAADAVREPGALFGDALTLRAQAGELLLGAEDQQLGELDPFAV